MKKILILLLFFIHFNGYTQQAATLQKTSNNNTLLWKITGKGLSKPSYLFGTFHLLCKDDIVFSDNLKEAITASKELYFEIDLDDPKSTLGGMQFMQMHGGKSLKDYLSAADYEKVSNFFKDSLKANLSFFSKMKPMLLSSFLYPKMMACKTTSGVEMELLTIAKNEKKPVQGFETIEFQAGVFDSIPYQKQANELVKSIDSIKSYTKYFIKMVNTYKAQQTDSLMAIANDKNFADMADMDILLKNRNENWVKQLKNILPNNNIFIAVGAAHLFGKDGLIKLLKKQGYKVTPVAN